MKILKWAICFTLVGVVCLSQAQEMPDVAKHLSIYPWDGSEVHPKTLEKKKWALVALSNDYHAMAPLIGPEMDSNHFSASNMDARYQDIQWIIKDNSDLQEMYALQSVGYAFFSYYPDTQNLADADNSELNGTIQNQWNRKIMALYQRLADEGRLIPLTPAIRDYFGGQVAAQKPGHQNKKKPNYKVKAFVAALGADTEIAGVTGTLPHGLSIYFDPSLKPFDLSAIMVHELVHFFEDLSAPVAATSSADNGGKALQSEIVEESQAYVIGALTEIDPYFRYKNHWLHHGDGISKGRKIGSDLFKGYFFLFTPLCALAPFCNQEWGKMIHERKDGPFRSSFDLDLYDRSKDELAMNFYQSQSLNLVQTLNAVATPVAPDTQTFLGQVAALVQKNDDRFVDLPPTPLDWSKLQIHTLEFIHWLTQSPQPGPDLDLQITELVESAAKQMPTHTKLSGDGVKPSGDGVKPGEDDIKPFIDFR